MSLPVSLTAHSKHPSQGIDRGSEVYHSCDVGGSVDDGGKVVDEVVGVTVVDEIDVVVGAKVVGAAVVTSGGHSPGELAGNLRSFLLAFFFLNRCVVQLRGWLLGQKQIAFFFFFFSALARPLPLPRFFRPLPLPSPSLTSAAAPTEVSAPPARPRTAPRRLVPLVSRTIKASNACSSNAVPLSGLSPPPAGSRRVGSPSGTAPGALRGAPSA